MATNEPMTDARLAEISARVKNAWAIQAVGPANMGDLEPWQLQSIAVAYVDDVADLIAENDRLRAREQALATENAAMRPVVEALAKWGIGGGLPVEFYHQARAFVAAHPDTAAGEAESEWED